MPRESELASYEQDILPRGPANRLNPLPDWVYDRSKWGTVTNKDWLGVAKSQGYTGDAKNAVPFLFGMVDKTGTKAIPKGSYGDQAAGSAVNGDLWPALDAWATEHRPNIRNQYIEGFKRNVDDLGGGDILAGLWTAGVGGMALSELGALGSLGDVGGIGGEVGADGLVGGASDLGADLGFTGGAAGGDVAGTGVLAGGGSGATTVGAVGGELSGVGGATLGGALGGSAGTYIDAAGNVIDAGLGVGTPVGTVGGNPLPGNGVPSDTLPGGGLPGDGDTGGLPGDGIDTIPGGGGTGGDISAPSWLDDLTNLISGIPSNIWGAGIQGLLGYLGADAKSDALKDVFNTTWNEGAWARGLNEASYQPGFDLYSQPGYGDAFKRSADVAARAAGVHGNPGTTPSLQAGIMNDVWSGSYLPALASYRGGLRETGGIGTDTASAAALAGANVSSPWLTGLGTAAGSIFGSQNKNPLQITIGGNAWGN